MKWYVLKEDWNTHRIEQYNIFNHGRFHKEIEEIPECTREEFDYQLKMILRYYFWCKAEYEIAVGSVYCELDRYIKLDIYSQVMMNWDKFSDYVWSVKHEI